jgi:sigma-B regulation protein RsbU (phosphoserine phosphatase)
VIPNKQFAEKSFTLAEGEILILYTDGVTEAFNRNGDLFQLQRLLDIAQQQCDRPPQEFMLAVIGGVDAFAAGAVQNDDITCLVIRRKASGAKLGAA